MVACFGGDFHLTINTADVMCGDHIFTCVACVSPALYCQGVLVPAYAVSHHLDLCQCSRIHIVPFFKIQKNAFLRFLEICQKRRRLYQSFRRKSIKSLAYTVRSETTNKNYIYIQHYIKLLIKI